MKLDIVPERVIPARYEIVFWEDRQHRGFVISDADRTDSLRNDIREWLDANDPGWTVDFDRGDWGEGPTRVIISLTSETAAREFHQTWNQGRCVEESFQSCPNMKQVAPDTYGCAVCGESFRFRRIDPEQLGKE